MGSQRNGRKRRIPLGKPLKAATEADAEITPEDIERARQSWIKSVPARFRDLLDAEIVQGDEFD